MLSRLKKWLSGPQSPDAHPYYGERLQLLAHQITLTRTNGDNANIRLNDVDYVTIYRFANDDGRDLCWVNLKSYARAPLSVTTLAGNFHQLEAILLAWAGFDVARYLKIKQSTQAYEEQVLWKKDHQPDFSIEAAQQSSSLALLAHGLMMESAQQFIPWGSYASLSAHPAIAIGEETFPNPRFKAIKYVLTQPVIARGLKLNSLYTCCDAYENAPKLELPVIEWTSQISLGGNRTKSFNSIKTHLDAYFEKQPAALSPQVGEDLQASWHHGSVTFKLHAFYRDETKDWDNVAWLRINYQPDLEAYYRNDYQQNLMLNPSLSYLKLNFSMGLHVDYRQVDNAMYTPKCFKSLLNESVSLVWRDDEAGKIGFANQEYARVFNLHEIQSLQLAVQNFRGSEGRNALEIVSQGEAVHLGGLSDLAAFKKAALSIAKVIKKEVTHYTYDEHY